MSCSRICSTYWCPVTFAEVYVSSQLEVFIRIHVCSVTVSHVVCQFRKFHVIADKEWLVFASVSGRVAVGIEVQAVIVLTVFFRLYIESEGL